MTRARQSLLAVTGLAALLAASPGALAAHGALKSSSPRSGAHLDVAPREIRLTFNERAERAVTRVELRGSDGRVVSLGDIVIPADTPTVVRAAITGALVGGVYVVRWQTAGRDGHPVRGQYSFVVAPGAAGLRRVADVPPPSPAADSAAPDSASTHEHHLPTAMPQPEGEVFGAESPLYAVVRWLTFLGTLGVIGAAVFRFAVVPALQRRGSPAGRALAEPSLDRAARVGLALGALVLAMTAVRLYAQSVAMHGAADALRPGYVASMVVQTLWGRAWALQLVGAALAAVGFAAARRGSHFGWRAVALASVLLALSPALSGHAAAVERFMPAVAGADAMHVLTASGWLGSLAFVVAAGIGAAARLGPGERGPAVADLVNAFSPVALACAALTLATGAFAAWVHLGTLSALWESTYGRTLLVKLAVLSVVAATGAYNWLRVRPALGDETGVRRIRRSSLVELGVGVLVLAVTAVLVATPPRPE